MDYSVGFILTFGLIIWLVGILALWQVFTKAGEAGWKCIIPIYNVWVLNKIGNQPVWVFILLLIPYVNIIGSILLSLGVAKSFDKSPAFGIIALWLFSFFGYLYLGWGDSEYVGEQASDSASE